MELVTLRNGQCLPAEAMNLAVELAFAGWILMREDGRPDVLRVVRAQDAGDEPLTDAMRESIRTHKPDLLRIVDTVEEIVRLDTTSGHVRTPRTRNKAEMRR